MTKKPAIGISGKHMLSEEQTMCRLKKNGVECRGVLSNVSLSRLEESLGHRKYKCDKCGVSYKFGIEEECV